MGASELVDSWELSLRAERKSPATVSNYLTGVRLYFEWCKANDQADEISRRAAQLWIIDLLEDGAEASTARARLLAVRLYSTWLAEEEPAAHPVDVLLGLRSPKIDVKVVEPLTVDELQGMLKTCDRRTFTGVRDDALIRFMTETGARAGEVVALGVEDINVKAGTAVVRRGKGGKGRIVAFGPKTAQALDRYLRLRRQHKHAGSARLWLGQQGPGFGYRALHKTLGARAEAAGVVKFHPHQLRNTWAMRWLEAGGSEGGAMAVGGWSSRSMLDRYTRATASVRAAAEAQKLDLGDI
ncbi:tyrosine-type recombinase/integrase [Kribbella sp. CA-293567]|uniref:tyrosine-type recombinase/integrase n=1 Tax=Kribbella sp. CA-293567 TaxID=3002436 RepID=UPI0022DDE0DA|nr:tyrosine-type recombinase/integrase [Kribbella sp. CA-293567]WBQ02953.1 tyrosine-type recombinase/integrase [Kribbella sp. CA-293567]